MEWIGIQELKAVRNVGWVDLGPETRGSAKLQASLTITSSATVQVKRLQAAVFEFVTDLLQGKHHFEESAVY